MARAIPDTPPAISQNGRTRTMWESCNYWILLFKRQPTARQRITMQEVAGVTLMTLTFLHRLLKTAVTSAIAQGRTSDATMQEDARALRRLNEVVQMLNADPVVVDIKKYQSVALYDDPGRNVDLAVTAAVTIWDTICEPYLQGQIKKLPSALLVQQEMAWAAISMVVETSKDQRFIEIKDIRLKLSKIRAWKIGVDPKRPAKATEPSSGKRMRTEAADEDQDILAKMQLSPEEQQELRSLTLAIPRPSGAIDSTPEDTIPTQADMESLLAPETELYDSVIFCYLVLVCHKANGHIAGLSTPQRIAPKWYVWDANASQNINNESETFWPPRHYPTAQIDELNILLFPMCLESTLRIGHWVMVVVEKMGHAWQHRLISSLPGFVAKAEIIWTPIARWLKNRHGIQVEESLSSVYDVTHLLPRTAHCIPPQVAAIDTGHKKL